ncbi:hypothetical protein PENSUB_10726 [Penicillium subrubescens]|uniref:Uncharacterized protein n=1 Tax=Penicillium subrubescens TaxID=1316194 RepID=A0A1Q5T8I8_9EURO|nr:hypothetical protein PENSUB_10726 [Penicillium subrubescens]
MAAEEHFLLFAGSLRQGAQVPSPWHFEGRGWRRWYWKGRSRVSPNIRFVNRLGIVIMFLGRL